MQPRPVSGPGPQCKCTDRLKRHPGGVVVLQIALRRQHVRSCRACNALLSPDPTVERHVDADRTRQLARITVRQTACMSIRRYVY